MEVLQRKAIYQECTCKINKSRKDEEACAFGVHLLSCDLVFDLARMEKIVWE